MHRAAHDWHETLLDRARGGARGDATVDSGVPLPTAPLCSVARLRSVVSARRLIGGAAFEAIGEVVHRNFERSERYCQIELVTDRMVQ